jgi:Cft2 family RNA processing exonuclease
MDNQEKNTLRIRFLGGIGTVSGSCTLLEYNCFENNTNHYFLVDAGAFQNEKSGEQEVERIKILKYFAEKIEYIFITHAHFDHIGILPDIIQYGFRGKVCCTQATHELIEPMLTSLNDSEEKSRISNLLNKIKFIEIDNRRGEKENKEFGKTYISITKDFCYGYLRSSHVLGSCTFYFQWTEKTYSEDLSREDKEWKYLYFSGDIGPVSKNVIANIVYKDHQTPYWDKYEKCIVMESTYGERIRDKDNLYQRKIDKLSEIINKAIKEKRTVIIPAFALDRAQQILIDLFCINKGIEVAFDKETEWNTLLKDIPNKALYKSKKIRAIPNLSDEEREKIQPAIEKVLVQQYNNINDKIENRTFAENCKECQEAIINILEKNNIQKSASRLNLTFCFDSPLIEKVNNIYLERLTDEVYSKKDGRKFRYISNDFLKTLKINDDNIFERKKKIKTMLSSFMKTEQTQYNKRNKQSKQTEQNKAEVIVTASGMCDEGTVVGYLEKYLSNENASIIITGFQAKDTNGSILKKLSNNEFNEEEKKSISLKVKNENIILEDIKCKIEDMSEYYSGHADQEQLLDYLSPDERQLEKLKEHYETLGKTTVLLNHGTNEAREILKLKIEERNKDIKVILPEFNKWLSVLTFEYEPEDVNFGTAINEFIFTKVGDIHIYYPKTYDEEKKLSIIEYIKKN